MRILTFDLEEWYHILDNNPTRDAAQWPKFESRIEANVDRLMQVLEDNHARATFFALGWIADRYPQVIKQISSGGCEIGTHSYAHQLVYEQQRPQFAADLHRSVALIEDLTGKKVRCYRAPGFSLTPRVPWVFDELLAQGIEIDCSIFPAARAHGGFPRFGAAEPVIVRTGSGGLKELPMNAACFCGKRFVFSGGGYFRLLPYSLIKRLVERSPYVMTYFHPRDFDPAQPLVPGLNFQRRLKCYAGLKSAECKLRQLLTDFAFSDINEADQKIDWSACRTITVGAQ